MGALLTQRLQAQGYGYQIVNASVSGETTAEAALNGCHARCSCISRGIVILELGANDGLRGLPLAVTRDNLGKMIELAQGARCPRAAGRHPHPAQLRAALHRGVRGMFPALAKQYHLPLVPFLLEDVALNPALMQEDGMHPNAAASRLFSTRSGRIWSRCSRKNP